MRKGEKGILIGIAVVTVTVMVVKAVITATQEEDKGIPYYTTASNELSKKAGMLIRKYNCRDCHSLWTQRSIMQSVPAPALDGMGSMFDEEWFYSYFSAANPQSIVPSRLKAEFRMPSFARVPEDDRRLLSKYLASLKVEDWYLEETKKRAYEKLTGKEYKP